MLREERGSVSVLMAGVLAILLLCSLGIADVGRVVLGRAEAQNAADAAALAAAQDLAYPVVGADPAASAEAWAAANGATLTACRCETDATRVSVQVKKTVGPLRLLPAQVDIVASASAAVVVPAVSQGTPQAPR